MKYFVFGDIHGFYDEFIDSLTKAGYDRDNPTHCLVSLGDVIDRGPKPREVIQFLLDAPNRILLLGNHELLMEELLATNVLHNYDYDNGTYGTVLRMTGQIDYKFAYDIMREDPLWKRYISECKWYHEIKYYIFTHAWIPTDWSYSTNKRYDRLPEKARPHIEVWKEDWRDANAKEWKDSTWANGPSCAADGLNQTGKYLVCGHWHCSRAWVLSDLWHYVEFPDQATDDKKCCFEPCFYKGCWFIDGCVPLTKKVNMLVIDEIEGD